MTLSPSLRPSPAKQTHAARVSGAHDNGRESARSQAGVTVGAVTQLWEESRWHQTSSNTCLDPVEALPLLIKTWAGYLLWSLTHAHSPKENATNHRSRDRFRTKRPTTSNGVFPHLPTAPAMKTTAISSSLPLPVRQSAPTNPPPKNTHPGGTTERPTLETSRPA